LRFTYDHVLSESEQRRRDQHLALRDVIHSRLSKGGQLSTIDSAEPILDGIQAKEKQWGVIGQLLRLQR